MQRPPLIGLPGRRKKGADIVGFPDVLADRDLELYFTDYARGVIAAGGLPVHLPIEADPVALAAHLDGVLLTGGADLSPDLYGAESETDLFPPEVDRDAFELALVDEALDRDLPVLGICRGLQLLNVHAGGSLHQHVPEHSRFDISPSSRVHDVVFEPGSRLGELYGERARVNTLHHQTVDRVGAAFTVTARADDGTVEGLEVPGADVVAVQWHPEMLTDPEPVFTWLVDAARAHAT